MKCNKAIDVCDSSTEKERLHKQTENLLIISVHGYNLRVDDNISTPALLSLIQFAHDERSL